MKSILSLALMTLGISAVTALPRTWDRLAAEEKTLILDRLSASDIANFARASPAFHEAVRDETRLQPWTSIDIQIVGALCDGNDNTRRILRFLVHQNQDGQLPITETLPLIFRIANQAQLTGAVACFTYIDDLAARLLTRNNGKIPVRFLIQNRDILLQLIATFISNTFRSMAVFHLDLVGLNLNQHDAALIANGLVQNTELKRLDLSANNIGVQGAQAMAAVLVVNRSLRHLSLTANNILGQGAAALAGMLVIQNDDGLEYLVLGDNNIGDQGAQVLAEALSVNTALRHLSLPMNGIGPHGAIEMAAAVSVNHALKSLIMGGNQIFHAGSIAFAQALTNNESLEHLQLWDCGIDDLGVSALGLALSRNTALKQLTLSLNDISDASLDENGDLARSLIDDNHTLEVLDLSANDLSPAAVQAFAALLAEHRPNLEVEIFIDEDDDEDDEE